MPMLTRLHCAITIDVLMRVSLVLTAGLLLALMARRNAALRHAILVAGLVAAFIVPAAMLTMQVLPVSRLPLDLPGRVGLDGFAAVTEVSSQPPSKPHHDSTSYDHPAPAIASTRGDEARPGPGASVSTPLDERSLAPHASNWLNAHDGPFMATGLLSALLMGAIVKVTGLGISLLRLRRIVARRVPLPAIKFYPCSGRFNNEFRCGTRRVCWRARKCPSPSRRASLATMCCCRRDGPGVCARKKCWRSSVTSPRTSRDATITS